MKSFLAYCFSFMSLEAAQEKYISDNSLFVLICNNKPVDECGIVVGSSFIIHRPIDPPLFASSLASIKPALFQMADLAKIDYKKGFFNPGTLIFTFSKEISVFNEKKEKEEPLDEFPISDHYNHRSLEDISKKTRAMVQKATQTIFQNSKALAEENPLPETKVFV